MAKNQRTVIAASAVSVVVVLVDIGQSGGQGRPLVDQVRMLSLCVSAGVRVSFDGLDDVLLSADGHVTRLATLSKYKTKDNI